MSLNLRILYGLFLILALGACGTASDQPAKKEDKFAKCPRVALVADAAGFINGTADKWTNRAAIDTFKSTCKIDHGQAEMEIDASLTAQRSSKTGIGNASYPLFVAVTGQDDKITTKTPQSVTVHFKDGTAAATKDITLKQTIVFQNNTAADKTILFGFQLTPAQLATLRALRLKHD